MGFAGASVWIAIQALLQIGTLCTLWCILFWRLGHRDAWMLFAFFPLVGLFASTFFTVVLGRLNLTPDAQILAFSTVPSLISFLFAIAPLLVLILRTRPTSKATDTFS